MWQVWLEESSLGFSLESPVDLAEHLILPGDLQQGEGRWGAVGGEEGAACSLIVESGHHSHALSITEVLSRAV